MFPILMVNAALAGSVSGGIQVAAFPGALDFASDALTGQTLSVYEDEFSEPDVGCYDAVGVRDLNLTIPLNSVDLSFYDDTLLVDIHFGLIEGEDMVLFGEDDSWDICPSIEASVNSLSLNEGRLLVEFAALMEDGEFDLEVVGSPTFTGDLETDIDWVPDSLVLSFFEDSIFETIEDMIVEKVPEIAMGLLGNSVYAGRVGDIELDVQLEDVRMDNSIMIGMSVDAEWLGDGCPISGVLSEPEGADPEVTFDPATDSDIGVAITEYQINRLFFGAWEDGLLCFEAGPLYSAIEMVESLLGDNITNSDVDLSFNRAPSFELSDDGIKLTVDGLHLALYGDIDGEQRSIVGLDASMSMDAEIRVNHELSSFVFDLTAVELELDALVVDPLINDRDGVSDRLIGFLEGWAMETLANRIANVPLYGNLFELSDMFLRVDEMSARDGAIRIYGSLYEADDPEVDTEAPDTNAHIAQATQTRMRLAWSADDNEDGPFAYSWRINSGPWSYWTTESGESFDTPAPGTHIIEVRARDAWLNIDPSPKTILFKVELPPERKGCGCTTGASPAGWIPWTLGALFLGVRRRRE